MFVALVAALATLGGCAPYNHPFEGQGRSEKYELHVIQSDDYGSFWGTRAAQSALDAVDRSSRTTNTFAVLFIHGWNHNAEADDKNLANSKLAMDALYQQLDQPERRQLREAQTHDPNFHLVAIYVGWRGRTLPGPLNYLTFWGRKAAAERVGDGDFAEFMQRLQHIYITANQRPDRRITGLVTIGHSFGAQVLWRSLARSVEAPLVAYTSCLSNSLDPTQAGSDTPFDVVRQPINGFGDLNVLLNPATEAYQFARVDALYRRLRYAPTQTPQIVVFSSTTDRARQIWFPLARGTGFVFRPTLRNDFDGYQGALYGKALGELGTQVTHELVLTDERDSLSSDDLKGIAQPGGSDRLGTFDFSGPTAFGGVELKRSEAGRPAIPQSPVIVARVDPAIIDGHNDIFQAKFRNFLASYISFIEAKRLMSEKSNRVSNKEASLSVATKEPRCEANTIREASPP